MISQRAAQCLVQVAADGIRSSPEAFHEVLDELAAPIYSTDRDGTLTYYNRACIRLAGRTPRIGTDKWCVTWKIYTTQGKRLPHEECPMAVAIRERRAVRGVEAVAERPDGTRINFMPFPTPVFDDDGQLAGAVNLLLDITERGRPRWPDEGGRARLLPRLAGGPHGIARPNGRSPRRPESGRSRHDQVWRCRGLR